MKNLRDALMVLSMLMAMSCSQGSVESEAVRTAEGKLFIIGGGKRPAPMIERLIGEAGLKEGGYGIILPMSSSEPDSSIFYAKIQFQEAGLQNVAGMNLSVRKPGTQQLDSIRSADLIYISGGDQNRFMKTIEGTKVAESIHEAWQSGCVIAGTSAGAAVMSDVMITGDEKNYPEYSNTLRNIEPDNVITTQGLGLITRAVIDQHFIKRARYNRLISVILDHPGLMGIGIDEATAILVDGQGKAEVIGDNQVIVLRHSNDKKVRNKKMGAKDIRLDVLLAGDTFQIEKVSQ